AEDPFSYTTLIQLAKIFDKKWGLLSKRLPPKLESNKSEFTSRLERINRIRNAVMHPCKGIGISDDDFLMVRNFYLDLTSRSRTAEHYSFANLHTSQTIN